MPPKGLTGRQLLRRLYSMPHGEEVLVLESISRNGLQFMKAMDLWEVSRNIGNICHSARDNLRPASEMAAAPVSDAEATAVEENPLPEVVEFAAPMEAEPPLEAVAPVLDAEATTNEENPPPEVLEFAVPVEVKAPLEAAALAPDARANPSVQENTNTNRPSSKEKVEQALVRVYSEGEMTPEIADTVKDQFKQYDKNGDGMISYTEFCNVMRSIGDFTDKELNDMFKQVDKSGDGDVSYEEFIDWVMTPDSDSDSDENEE